MTKSWSQSKAFRRNSVGRWRNRFGMGSRRSRLWRVTSKKATNHIKTRENQLCISLLANDWMILQKFTRIVRRAWFNGSMRCGAPISQISKRCEGFFPTPTRLENSRFSTLEGVRCDSSRRFTTTGKKFTYGMSSPILNTIKEAGKNECCTTWKLG